MRKHTVIIKLTGLILSWVLRLQRLTWRVHIEGQSHLDRLFAGEKSFLICFWHGKYIPIFPIMEGYKVCIVSSLSVRGSIIAEICRNFGYQNTQVPDRPKCDSLKLLQAGLSRFRSAGIAVDGPLGPRGQVKSGVIRIASALGTELLPVSVYSHRKIIFSKRWDQMEIPLPFTKVWLVIGEPVSIPAKLDPQQTRIWMDNLTQAIMDLSGKAKSMVSGNR